MYHPISQRNSKRNGRERDLFTLSLVSIRFTNSSERDIRGRKILSMYVYKTTFNVIFADAVHVTGGIILHFVGKQLNLTAMYDPSAVCQRFLANVFNMISPGRRLQRSTTLIRIHWYCKMCVHRQDCIDIYVHQHDYTQSCNVHDNVSWYMHMYVNM